MKEQTSKLMLVCHNCGQINTISYFHYMAKSIHSTFKCDKCDKIILTSYDN